MENQHRHITEYRELTSEEIALINKIKSFGENGKALIDEIRQHLLNQERTTAASEIADAQRIVAQPWRWASIGETDLQTGLMALTRADAQPTNF